MIEYKFRGKRVDNGEWVFGKLFFLDNPDFYSILPVGGLAFPEVSTESETGRYLIEPIEVIPETIGQFTGLHDKNCVEIYDGDIVVNDDGKQEKIVFHRGAFKALSISHPNANLYLLDSYSDYLEVIGNIHDKE